MRMPRKKIKKQFKREYIPVIIAGIILVLLLAALVVAILYKLPTPSTDDVNGESDIQEILVDSASMINEKNRKEYEELVEKAKKIETSYVLKQNYLMGYFYPEDYEGEETYPVPEKPEYATYRNCYNVTFTNLTKDIYLYISDSAQQIEENNHLIQTKMDKEDITVLMAYVQEVNTYTVEVRASNGDLAGTVLRKFSFKTPMFNYNSKLLFCKNHPDLKACAETSYEYISQGDFEKEKANYYKKHGENESDSIIDYIYNNIDPDIVNNNEALTEVKEKKNKKEKETTNNIIDFIKKHLVMVIIVGSIVILGVAATVIYIVKKKRSSKYEV